MLTLVEYGACLILAALVATVLFAVCAIFMLLSEGAASIFERLVRGLAHEARESARGQTWQTFCDRVRSGFRRIRSWGLAKEVAMFQMVNEEPRQPQERKKMVLVKVAAFSVALLALSAIVCFFVFLPYTNR
jgi:hypothetical protein